METCVETPRCLGICARRHIASLLPRGMLLLPVVMGWRSARMCNTSYLNYAERKMYCGGTFLMEHLPHIGQSIGTSCLQTHTL